MNKTPEPLNNMEKAVLEKLLEVTYLSLRYLEPSCGPRRSEIESTQARASGRILKLILPCLALRNASAFRCQACMVNIRNFRLV